MSGKKLNRPLTLGKGRTDDTDIGVGTLVVTETFVRFECGLSADAFPQRENGVDIRTCRVRAGTFIAKRTVTPTAASHEVGMTAKIFWFSGQVIVTLLMIGGVEILPGPSTGQKNNDQILKHVRNQEEECEVVKSLLNSHNQEITGMKNGPIL
jgi:hypothetical protein